MWFCLANGLLHRRTPWVLFQPPPWHTICLRVLTGGRQDSQCFSSEYKFRKPEQTAVVDGISGEVTSRKKLREGILRTSSSFQNLLDPGSTVAVSLPNIPQVQLSFPESIPSQVLLHSTCSLCSGQSTQVQGCASSTQSTLQRRPSDRQFFNGQVLTKSTRHAMQLTKPKAVVTTAISLPSILPSLPEVTIKFSFV